MKQSNIFTEDFYSELYDAVLDVGCNCDYYYEDILDDKYVDIDCYVGDLYITATVHYTKEWHDDSFDHLFGTWHDPYPYWEVTGFDDITDVKVYESDDNDSKEIEGFSYKDFNRIAKL